MDELTKIFNNIADAIHEHSETFDKVTEVVAAINKTDEMIVKRIDTLSEIVMKQSEIIGGLMIEVNRLKETRVTMVKPSLN